MQELLDLDADQAKCLVSPLRAQIMQIVLAERPVSPADLARLLDIHEKTIYYHVRKLEKAGLITPVGQRYGTTKPETVYDPVARRLRWKPDKYSREQLDLVSRRLHNLLRRAEREAAAAHAADRKVLVQAARLRLTAADAEAFQTKLNDLTTWAMDRRDPEGQPLSFGAFLIELEPKR